ncbi:MAG TPA: hypothetical protein VF828_02000 [Patescibacteria group bacterium]
MPQNSPPQRRRLNFARHVQISDSHCGPAVVQMLLENHGVITTQEDIVHQAAIEKTLEKHGSRIDQLAYAVKKIRPDFDLLYKDLSNLNEIDEFINSYDLPVAVEWQGLFEEGISGDNEDLSYEDTDYGHYSIISRLDTARKELIIVDPYKDFIDQDRIFSFSQFLDRWWDSNEVTDSLGDSHQIVDNQLFFIIVPQSFQLPPDIKLKRGTEYLGQISI